MAPIYYLYLVLRREFREGMENAPQTDLDELRSFVDRTQSACIFVADLEKEDMLK